MLQRALKYVKYINSLMIPPTRNSPNLFQIKSSVLCQAARGHVPIIICRTIYTWQQFSTIDCSIPGCVPKMPYSRAPLDLNEDAVFADKEISSVTFSVFYFTKQAAKLIVPY